MRSNAKYDHLEGRRGLLLVLLSSAALLMSIAALMAVFVTSSTTQAAVSMSNSAGLQVGVRQTSGSNLPVLRLSHQQQHNGGQSAIRGVQDQGVTIGRQPGTQQPAAASEAASCAPAPAAEDPLAGLSAVFLQQVLKLSNYSNLGSAPLLDMLVASKNYPQMQEVVRQQQTLFCRAKLQDLDMPGVQQVTAQGVKFHLYSQGDIVSNSIRGSGTWESPSIAQLQWAIDQHRLSTGSGSGAAPLVVDVGSNVGWMTFAAAKMGARVIAFEGMPTNQLLLRYTLCDNPDLMQHISLFATGLGDTAKDCTVVSSATNAGNGNVVCTSDVQAAMHDLSQKTPGNQHFEVRGSMSIRRLDDLLAEDIYLLKLDVEGFEESVLKGAHNLLSGKRVKFLITEVNPELRSKAGRLEYLRMLYELGFDISTTGFTGPFLSREVIYDHNTRLPSWDVYGRRRD